MSTVTSADGTQIAYDSFGEGPAVILIGGATKFRGNDPGMTETAQDLARRGFTAVVYDRRGRGASTDTPPYAVRAEVDDLQALIVAVGGRAALFGSSSGAVLALWAAQAQIGVSKLVLWEPPLIPEDNGQAFLAAIKDRIAVQDRDGAIAAFMGDVQEEWLEGLRNSPAYPAIWNLAPTLAYDAEVLADALTGTPWAQQWDRVDVPTLVLFSEHTLPAIPPAADGIVAALPHASRRKVSSEHSSRQAAQLASLIASALTPYEGCAWPCAGCAAANPPATRSMDTSGPVPLYEG